jgi:hypothetical protein
MNLSSIAPVAPKARRELSPAEKLEATALTSARAAGTKLLNAFKYGTVSTWEHVQRELGIEIPEAARARAINLEILSQVVEYWIRNAPDRARKEQVRIAEERDARERRTYSTIDIPLPGGMEFKPQQKKAIAALLDVLFNQNLDGALVPLGTGKGKSWIAAGLALWLQKHKPSEFMNFMAIFPPILIITKRSVVLEFRDTCKRLGLKDIGMAVDVMSYNELMSKKNAAFFRKDTVEVFGQKSNIIRFGLPNECAPRAIIVDECQELKKEKAKRTKYLASFIDIPGIKWVFTSATPAVTLQDTMFMTLAMKIEYGGRVVNRELFPEFARALNEGSKIPLTKPNSAALERWSAAIGDRFIRPPNDPQKVKALNRVKLFEITDPTNWSMVVNAMSNYTKALEATGRSVDPQGQVMVAFMVMARAAELATVDQWVADAIELHKQGYAPVLAIRFTETLKEYVLKLSESAYFKSLGYTRSKISLIWGGQKEIREEDLLPTQRASEVGGMIGKWILDNPDATRRPTADELGIDPAELRAFNKGVKYTSERLFREMTKDAFAQRNIKLRELKLHNQSQEERHENVKAFIEGGTEFCVYTLSSGGTGISLDHRYVHCRPRWVMSTMTYWAEEFAQALGRCVRVSTITDTVQEIYIPMHTLLSDHMAPKLASKLKSIDAIGSSNIDLASELERAVRKREAGRKLTEDELKGSESTGIIEVEEDDDDEEEGEK